VAAGENVPAAWKEQPASATYAWPLETELKPVPIPEFILELRKKIGHDLLWLPGVTAVVFDPMGRVLLVRRSDNGHWTLVTGCLEPGEQPAAGAIREVREETGVEVEVERVLRVQAMPAGTCVNGDRVQFLDTALLCRAVTFDAHVNDDESTEVGWFDLDERPALSARHTACIDAARNGSTATWFDGQSEAPVG
jgi:8-oxo-dGTP pyrophosphatase MutT (NUDIX family)